MSEVLELSNFIGGEWLPASCDHWIDDFAPATGELIARIPCSSSEDVDAAVNAAREALTDWSALSISDRAEWLDRIASALEERDRKSVV
jgi:acyl-CoA reductase-like NAD-dependent aldehyde dehydrogenase